MHRQVRGETRGLSEISAGSRRESRPTETKRGDAKAEHRSDPRFRYRGDGDVVIEDAIGKVRSAPDHPHRTDAITADRKCLKAERVPRLGGVCS